MNCQCGAPIAPMAGRGRPRKRCEPCAADKSRLGKEWRAANPARVDAYNASRREAYASQHEVARARGRLRYALMVGRRIAQATLDVERARMRA